MTDKCCLKTFKKLGLIEYVAEHVRPLVEKWVKEGKVSVPYDTVWRGQKPYNPTQDPYEHYNEEAKAQMDEIIEWHVEQGAII